LLQTRFTTGAEADAGLIAAQQQGRTVRSHAIDVGEGAVNAG
jgi:hypothetical protein